MIRPSSRYSSGLLGRLQSTVVLMLAILGPCGIFSSESVLASGNRPQPVSVADDPVASAVWEVREVKGKDETRYDITIYQVPAPGGVRWIWRAFDEETENYPGGFPIGSLRIQRKGKPRPELFDPLSPGVMQALVAIHAAVEAEEGEGWADGNAIGIRRTIPVVRSDISVETGFSLKGQLKPKEVEIRGGKKPLKLTAFEEELLYDEKGALIEAHWVGGFTRGGEASPGRELHLKRSSVEILEQEKGDEIESCFEFLQPVVRVLRKGMSLPAVELAEEMFKKERKTHEKGALGAVVKEIAGLLKEARELAAQPLDPDERAKKMLGKPAPDFTLEDLDGDPVKLSDYVGKVVMLAFWGYS